jgi:hypothetical protein
LSINKKKNMSFDFAKRIKEVPLKTRLLVSNQMDLISFLTAIGVRECKPWGDDEDELMSKLCHAASEMTDRQLKTIQGWEDDGKP